MNMLARILWRFQSLLPAFVSQLIERQRQAELRELALAAAEAHAAESAVDRFAAEFRAALTDHVSPGVIDAREARALIRRIGGLKPTVHRPTAHLHRLMS